MPPLIYADRIYESGTALFGKACELDLEGTSQRAGTLVLPMTQPSNDFYIAAVVVIMFLIGIGVSVAKVLQQRKRHSERHPRESLAGRRRYY